MINKVILIGHLGQDPEVKTFDNGNKMCYFSVATSEGFKNKIGEWVERTEWHSINVYGPFADRLKGKIFKGSKVFIEGKINTSKWTDKEGNEHEKKFIHASYVRSMDAAKEKAEGLKSKDDDSPF